MSEIWTTEDAKKLDAARPERLRFSHPTAWQGIFHSDWQLASQGASPWLPIQERRTAAPLGAQLYVRDAQGNVMTFAPHTECAAKADIIFDKCSVNPHLKPVRRAGSEKPNEWALFVYDCKHRGASESTISKELSDTVRESRSILQLQVDWDGDGSRAYSEATLNRATTFLISNALRYWRSHQNRLVAPRILPGPDGNIDLHWNTPRRELLISIPADPAESAAYYGDDKEDGTENAIRGKGLDISQPNEWLFAWLMR